MPVILQVNYWAVLVCGVISMGVGALWYSPIVLGKTWMEAVDKSEEELKKGFNPIKIFGLSFLGHLFVAYSLAQLMAHSNASTVSEGIRLSFLCWLGFIAAPMAINHLFESGSKRLLLIDSGYHLIVMLIFGIILGAWTI